MWQQPVAFMGPSSSCESVPRSCLPHTNPHRLTISHQAFTRAHRLYAVCLLRLYGGISDVLKELFDDWDNDARSEGVVSALYLKKNNQTPPHCLDPRTPGVLVPGSSLARWLLLPLTAAHPSSRHSELHGPRRFCHRGDVCHRAPPLPHPLAEQPFHAPA